ncbi:MAG TPA: DUF3892 domain-containing protein [Micavibrio sp.]|nr:DUF3892 domain-containing protein [Micavibrio sp.]
MTARHKVRFVKKEDRYNPYERILSIGGQNADGTNWEVTQPQAIAGIEKGEWQFYVEKQGESANVVVRISPYGNKYIKTEADGAEPNNLLSLPECYS